MSQLATSFFFQRSSRRTRGSRARSRGKAVPDVTLLINNAGATGGYGDTTGNEGVGAGADLRLRLPSALDVGLGSIIAGRHFVVPTTILVLVRDARRVSPNDLFFRCALRPSAGHVVGREGLGEHPIDPVGPTAVMFDDLIGDLGHVSLLTR